MITYIKQEYIVDILWEANLCQTSPMPKESVPEVGSLEVWLSSSSLHNSQAKCGSYLKKW